MFQVIFKEEFNCRLCHEILYRCGLLTPAWPTKLAEADFVSQPRAPGGDVIGHPSIDSVAHPLSSITRSPSPPSPAALVPRTPRVEAEEGEALTGRTGGGDSREEPFLRLETVADSPQEIITAHREDFCRDHRVIALSSLSETPDGKDTMAILASQERARRLILGAALPTDERDPSEESDRPIEIVISSSQDDDDDDNNNSVLSLVEAPASGPDADFSFLRQTSYDEYMLFD